MSSVRRTCSRTKYLLEFCEVERLRLLWNVTLIVRKVLSSDVLNVQRWKIIDILNCLNFVRTMQFRLVFKALSNLKKNLSLFFSEDVFDISMLMIFLCLERKADEKQVSLSIKI